MQLSDQLATGDDCRLHTEAGDHHSFAKWADKSGNSDPPVHDSLHWQASSMRFKLSLFEASIET